MGAQKLALDPDSGSVGIASRVKPCPTATFVPLEILEIDSEVGSHGHLHLSRHWPWKDFPDLAWSLARALDARVGMQASDEASHVWEVSVQRPFLSPVFAQRWVGHARRPHARSPCAA